MTNAYLGHLSWLVESPPTDVGAQLRVALNRLLVEMRQRRNSALPTSTDFFTTACRLLGRLRGTPHAELRLSCLLEAYLFFFSHNKGNEALEVGEALLGLARRSNKKSWIRRGEMNVGNVLADLGNVPDGVSHLTNALSIAREIRDENAEISVLVNLGAAFNYAGLFREAIPCFERAALMAAGNQRFDMEAIAYTNLAQSYLYLGKFKTGLSVISQCLAISEVPSDSDSFLSMAIRESTYSQLALHLGLFEDAKKHARRCADYAVSCGTNRARLVAQIVTSLCELELGDSQAALKRLEDALSRSDSRSLRTDALRALIQAYDRLNRPDEALRYMRELLEHISRTREQSVSILLSSRTECVVQAFEPDPSDLALLEKQEAQLKARTAAKELVNSQIEMLERLAVTASLADDPSGEHGYRVGRLSALLAREIGWPQDACHSIEISARLHDIGKIAIPDKVLLSPSRLQEAERHVVSAHSAIGAEILAKSNGRHLQMAEEVARFHHEHWDGRGYPTGTAGIRIPIHARIVAIADVFDALTHGKSYEKAWSVDAALETICAERGKQFDPELTDIFTSLVDRIRGENKDLDAILVPGSGSSPFTEARKRIRKLLQEDYSAERQPSQSLVS